MSELKRVLERAKVDIEISMRVSMRAIKELELLDSVLDPKKLDYWKKAYEDAAAKMLKVDAKLAELTKGD